MTRSHAVALNLFKTKSPDLLMAEAAAPERQLKRTLGALDLTAIGIGAIIGAGIFALTGTAAAGQVFSSRLQTPVINFIQAWISGGSVVFGRAGAGPRSAQERCARWVHPRHRASPGPRSPAEQHPAGV